MTERGTEKSQQCHNYFLQCSTIASERPQVRTWGGPNLLLAPGAITPLDTRTHSILVISKILQSIARTAERTTGAVESSLTKVHPTLCIFHN